MSERLFAAMAVSCVSRTSSSQNFDDDFDNGVCYALLRLGLSDLKMKNEQKQAIYAMYSGKDVFICLPTGFGKSICFQIHVLPFLFDHKHGLVGGKKRSCAIIVSPLIALMVDQVRNLRKSGVQAVIISCGSRENSVVGKEFLAILRVALRVPVIFSLLQKLWPIPNGERSWRTPLCSAECVQLWLISSL